MKTNEVSFAENINKFFACLGVTATCFFTMSSAAYASVAGHVQFVNGNVQITSSTGQIRPAQKGEAINEGDTLTSAQKSSAQIKMQDGGFVAVRPDTRLKFDQFVFSGKEDGSEKSFFSLFKGGFRAVTGFIGNLNKQNYKITTPAATIGIRGTDHETFLITPDSPLAQVAPVGAYNKVNVGETYIATDRGMIFVLPNQMGFAGGMDQMPRVQPMNPRVFTVGEAPSPEVEVQAAEDGETAQTTETTVATQEETAPIRETAVVDATAPATGGAPAAVAPTVTTTTVAAVVAPPPTPTTTLTTVAATGGTTADLTTGTVVTSTGQVLTVTDGLTATQAQAAADAAQAAANAAQAAATATTADNTTLAALTLVDVALATIEIGTATTGIGTADTAVTAAIALTADSTTAAANAATAQAAADVAATQAAAAQAALTANGAFADSTANPANITVQSANGAVQTANATVQTAASDVAAQNAVLGTIQSAASTALTSANTNLATASTSLTTANTQNAAITAAQGAITTQEGDAQAAAIHAQLAAAAAQAAATQAAALQAAGDLAGAQAQLLIAQQELAYAQQQLALAQAAQTTVASQLAAAQSAQAAASTAVTTAEQTAILAADAAATASTYAGDAQTAASAAVSALAQTDPAPVSTQAAIVAANAPIAAYNNPAVVTTDRFVGVMSTVKANAGGGYVEGYGPGAGFDGTGTANISFVLDGNGNLVEKHHAWYEETPASSNITQIVVADANVKRTGGTAVETFMMADNSIYAGRWEGGSLTITDNAVTNPVAAFTRNLGVTSEHWAIMLAPPAGYVQALAGSITYNKVAATSPTNAQGNAGTLNTATLTANFTSQIVDAALNLTIASKTLGVTATNMAINGSFFSTGTQVTATCSGCAGTYYANVGGGFAGDTAASAGLTYTLWTGAAPGATTGATDLIQGIAAFSAGTAPEVTAYDALAQTAADAAAAAAQAAIDAAAVVDAAAAALTLVDITPATTAIDAATTEIASADTAVGTATALSPLDATANATSAQTAADAALAAATVAQTAFDANGTFADSLTAVPAINAVQLAKDAAQTANTAVQAAVATVATQNIAMTDAQSAASTFLGTANTSLTTASTSLTTANDQNALITAAQSSAASEQSAAQTAAANAQAAAAAAQTAASQAAILQAAGDFAGAQAQMTIAQDQLAIALAQQSVALAAQSAADALLTDAQAAQATASTAVTGATTAANTAATYATTASAEAAAALAAADAATTALSDVATNLVLVNSNFVIIETNAPIAAYNNPAVVGDFIAAAMFPVAVTGGFNEAFAPSNPLQTNTMYVLDGSGNLVEARNMPFRVQANQNGNTLTPSIEGASGADIKWSGGTAADTFKLPDNSLYAGRWMNATVTVTDNATPANVYIYTPVASLWAVLLPPPAGYVPSLLGSATYTYTVGNATTPVDAFGNLGTLNSATLFADFTSQVVDAAIQLTISAGSMAGTFNVSGTALPIDPAGGFGVPNATFLTTACTVGTCAAGSTGYSADMGGSFAGTGAASIGMSYNIWPTTTTSADPATNSIQGLVAFTADATPSGPTYPPAGTLASFGRIPVGSTGAWERGRFNVGSMPQTNTNFVLDASGNLVRALRVQYNERPTWGGIAPVTNNYTDATVSYSGGVAYDFYSTPDGSVTIGRWEGGQMTIADNLAVLSPLVKNLGTTSSHWVYWTPPATGFVQTLVGTTTYTQVGATLPTDTFGNIGTMPVATLSADFTNQTIDAYVAFSIASQNLMVMATGVPIEAGGDFADAMLELGTAPSVTCTGTCAAGYLGNLTANIAGTAAMSADIHYSVWPTATQGSLVADLIQGVVAFNTSTAPATGTNPAAGSYIADFVAHVPVGGASPGYTMAWPFGNPSLTQANILLDGSGNMVRLSGTTFEEAGGPNSQPLLSIADATLTWSGGTAAEKHQTLGGDITFGRWQGGSLSVIDNDFPEAAPISISLAQTGGMTGPASSLWLYGSLSAPASIQSLVGTTTYTKTASTTPFDSLGNTGTLVSAALTANFTNQVVDAALQLTMNSLVFDVAATMPIGTFDPSGFETTPAYPATITCNICDFAYMSADLGGAFAGGTASDAVLGYGIALWVTSTPDVALASNIISGYVAFNTTTAPIVNPDGPLLAYVATNTSVAYTGAYGGGFNFIAEPGDVMPLGNPTTFTENYGSGWGYRTDVLNGATTGTPPTTTANGITFGVWEAVTSVSASLQGTSMPNQDGFNSMLPLYMYGAEGYLDSAVSQGVSTGPLIGTFTYNGAGSLSLDQNTWATSSLSTATLSANFTTQTVDVALAGTAGATSWTANSTGVPISFMDTANGAGAQFYDFLPVVTVNGSSCSPDCGADINGAFIGQNYAGAIVQYHVWDGNNLNEGGLLGFDRMVVGGNPGVTNGTPAPTGNSVVVTPWVIDSVANITTDGVGVLTGWSGSDWSTTVTPPGGSLVLAPVGSGSGTINWGLWGNWGAWDGGFTIANTFSYIPGAAQLHWITAPEPTPVYLAEVLTTTNTYNFVDGDVTSMDMEGVWMRGAISGTTSLTANFTTQTIAVSLAATVNGHSWIASTSNAPLQYSNGDTLNSFYADSNLPPSQPGYLTVTVDNTAANGSLSGQLVGAALDGAILKFSLHGLVTTPYTGYEYVQGVAALGAATANDPATPYRMVLTSMSDPMAPVPDVWLGGSYNNAARVVMNGSGYLTEFDDGSDRIQYASVGTGAGFVDQGSAVIGGETISWGRWDAGTLVNVQDRATGTWQNDITLTGGAHAVVGPIATGPVSLPVLGSYTYNNVGNTLPTDQNGVAGVLNSATLSADFAAQTVNVGVNVTAGGATLNAVATGVAIQNRTNFFTDSKMIGQGALVVTCTAGACGTTNGGGIGGGFGGPGGVAAAITYGFVKEGVNAGTVSGVAVFQR